MKKLRVLDLFSGIGGFSLGLERTGGFETVAFCEIDPDCIKVLHKHWPEVHKFLDIKDLNPRTGGYDVICGGFPCQDISVAGKQIGIKGERSGLWKEFLRIIKEVQPRYAIIENVANLRNQGLATVIKDLWSIGYGCEWHIISARAVGACHLRERIWIIAYPNIEGLERSRRPREAKEVCTQVSINASSLQPSDSDNLRLWQSFATKEEKSQWWTEATASFRDVLGKISEVKPTILRGDDGLPSGLHKNRIKQLGNSVVPQIPELIGLAILEYELGANERSHP